MQIFRDRQALHTIPELGLELPKTAAYVKNALKDLNCTIFSPLEYAVCAYFDFGAESEFCSLRPEARHREYCACD